MILALPVHVGLRAELEDLLGPVKVVRDQAAAALLFRNVDSIVDLTEVLVVDECVLQAVRPRLEVDKENCVCFQADNVHVRVDEFQS